MPADAGIADSMLLDAAYLPPGPGLEPALVLFPPVEISPGAWRRAEEAMAIPEHARRLTIAVGDPATPRFTPTRALAIGDAIPYFMSLAGKEVRPSVTGWILAAHIAQRMHEGTMRPRGDEATDAMVARVAGSMPDSSCSVLVELAAEDELLGNLLADDESGYGRLTQDQALTSFLDVARHALVLGLTSRQVPPKRAASRVLAGLQLRIELPPRADAAWPLTAAFADDLDNAARAKVLEEAGQLLRPLAGIPLTDLRDPVTVELSADEASAAIQGMVELQARGATLELPTALTRDLDHLVDARLRIGGRGGATTGTGRMSGGVARTARFRLEDLVSYDLEVALGGQEVDAAELRRLARSSGALVRVGEEWVALTDVTRDQLERLARVVESHDAHMANAHALAAALSGSAQLPGGITATVDRVDDAALERAIEHLRSPETFESVTPPEEFTGVLRPYQQHGLTWLAGMAGLGLGACLADDMGLGKTVQVIALLAHLRRVRIAEDAQAAEAGDVNADVSDTAADTDAGAADTHLPRLDEPVPPLRTLVVCPTSLIGNWERELARFDPTLDVYVHHGPTRSGKADPLAAADVVVTSYGLVARDRAMLASIGWDVLVFDEAQSVKNPDTEQARAVRALPGQFRVALTGTPMENRLLELWSILDLLNPGLLGRAAAFSRRFAIPIERAGDEEAARILRAITRPFMLRRVKHDPQIVPDLPEKQERTVVCTLTPEQAAMYQAIADQALTEVRRRDGIARRGAVLALLTRLKQVCNHPVQALGGGVDTKGGEIAGRSGKLDRLEAMLSEVVAEGDRALVFTQYAQMGDILNRYLPDTLGCETLYLHGGVPRLQREAMVQRFQAEDSDEPMVFVLSLKAGGLGLNLMNAAHVFHYDRWWNPAVEDQATDRTHRIGQTRQIQVHKLVCAGTLEERIAQIIDDKRALAGRIIEVSGPGEGWVTELADDELEELISLGASATVELAGDAN